MNGKHLHEIIDEMKGASNIQDKPWIGSIERRSFLKFFGVAGGGLVLAFSLEGQNSVLAALEEGAESADFVPNVFLRISPDGSILIYSTSPEVGQGIKTAFPMIVAEELDADWSDVQVEQSPIDESIYGRQRAGGSRSIPEGWNQFRRAGAVARAMLVSAAAQQWGVSTADCVTEKSEVIHRRNGQRLGYGELAEKAARLPVPDADLIPLKKSTDYNIIGQRITGVDNYKLVTGEPLFGVDQVVPGMLYAIYEKCPATGGRVEGANLDEIRSLSGVKDAFVFEGNGNADELMPGVAIVASSTWAAFNARRHLKVNWDETEAAKDDSKKAIAQAKKLANETGVQTIRDSGNVDQALNDAHKKLESFYIYPFVSHAPLEPQNCLAWYRDDGTVEIWAPTQAPERAVGGVSNTLNIPKNKISIHLIRAGGGFGRRLFNDSVCEAAAISKRVGAPVKLQWMREDDMGHDFYRVAGFHSLKGAIDSSGKLTGWQDHFITFSSDGKEPVRGGDISETEFPAPLIPNFKLTQTMLPLDTPCGWWRAPRSNGIAFAVQCFLHELALAAGRDHVDFLLEVMGEPQEFEPSEEDALNNRANFSPSRAAGVIKLAAEKANWGGSLPSGRGLGLAFHFSHSGHFAEVVEVSVDKNKKLKIHKVTVAGDVGPIINLSSAENQCEGSVIDGLSTALGLEISIKNGRIQESNFDKYPIMRISDAPEVAVHFVESNVHPTGLGEPALPPLAPALCNAIFDASGHRVRELPLVKEGFTV